MDACGAFEERILSYLDGELDAGQTAALERHLEGCPACRVFLARHEGLEGMLRRRPASVGEGTDDLLAAVRSRLARDASGSEGETPRSERSHRLRIHRTLLLLTGAAAMLLLAWGMYAWIGERKDDMHSDSKEEETTVRDTGERIETGPPDIPAEIAERWPPDVPVEIAEAWPASPGTLSDGRTGLGPALLVPEIDEQERTRARKDFARVLAELEKISADRLVDAFAEATESLRADGWRMDRLLAHALREEEGPALLTAIRLASRLPDLDATPGVLSLLQAHLESGVHPAQTMAAIAHIDGARGEEALGRALRNPLYRDQALAHLSKMQEKGAVARIREALKEEEDLARGPLSPFAAQAVASLARMGAPGAEAVLDLYRESGENFDLIHALEPVDPEFAAHLVDRLERLRGRNLASGCRLAASLRIQDSIRVFRGHNEDPAIRSEVPLLTARVGGPAAVCELVRSYTGPVSLRERRRFCGALAAVFDLYPEETGATLEEVMKYLDVNPEERSVLVEMLAGSEGGEACHALAWLVEHAPDLSSDAALALARTGSDTALERLIALLDRGKLPPGARVAAVAAAYHLGGGSVLKWIRGEGESPPSLTQMNIPKPGRERSLTHARFLKLMKYIEGFTH